MILGLGVFSAIILTRNEGGRDPDRDDRKGDHGAAAGCERVPPNRSHASSAWSPPYLFASAIGFRGAIITVPVSFVTVVL